MSKVWLITGSSRGLGRIHNGSAGGRRSCGGYGPQAGATRRPSSHLWRKHAALRAVALDVTLTKRKQRKPFDAAVSSFGRLDVPVNNASFGNVSPVEDTSLADFRAQIETNLFGVIIMTKAVLPYFRERRAGHLVQVTSISGRVGPAGRAHPMRRREVWGRRVFGIAFQGRCDRSGLR